MLLLTNCEVYRAKYSDRSFHVQTVSKTKTESSKVLANLEPSPARKEGSLTWINTGYLGLKRKE